MSALIGLVFSAHAVLQAAPCEGRPQEVPYRWEGAWADDDRAWIANELQTWFAAHDREGCAADPALVTEQLVLAWKSDAEVSLQLRRGTSVLGERTVALETLPTEGRTYAIAALAEELARSAWERPVRRDFSIGAAVGVRPLYAGPTLAGGGLALGWSPLGALTLELSLQAASVFSVSAPHGTAGGLSFWGDLGARYGLLAWGPVRVGPRLGVELGRLALWGVDTAGLRREGGAWWVVARGGLFVGVERDRWALRLCGSMGRTLSGAIVRDDGQRVLVLDGAIGEVAVFAEVRL